MNESNAAYSLVSRVKSDRLLGAIVGLVLFFHFGVDWRYSLGLGLAAMVFPNVTTWIGIGWAAWAAYTHFWAP